MRLAAAAMSLILVATVAAGCIGGGPNEDASDAAMVAWVGIDPPFEQSHGHNDPALHAFSSGLEAVAWHNVLPPDANEAGRSAYLNSEIIVHDDLAYVGWLGAPWALTVIDVSNPSTPEFVGALAMTGAWVMDVAVSHDGDWAFLAIYNGAAVGSVFSPTYVAEADIIPTGLSGPGVLVVDMRDKADLKQGGFFPIQGLGAHTASYYHHPNGSEYVLANKADPAGADGTMILEVLLTPAGLRGLQPVAFYERGLAPGSDGFPHDVQAQTHPITDQAIMYAAYWDHGLVLVDISDPANPATLGVGMPEDGFELQFHDAHPFPRLIDGRHYTVTTPEIPTGADTGHLRVWDTTDPTAPVHIGTYQIPGGWVVEADFEFSPHNFLFMNDGTIAWGHGHAGVWFLDWMTGLADYTSGGAESVVVREVGAATPNPESAGHPVWSPLLGTPWVWGVGIGSDDTVWALDITSGIHGYRLAPAR